MTDAELHQAAAALVARTCAAQNIEPHITDTSILDRVADIVAQRDDVDPASEIGTTGTSDRQIARVDVT